MAEGVEGRVSQWREIVAMRHCCLFCTFCLRGRDVHMGGTAWMGKGGFVKASVAFGVSA